MNREYLSTADNDELNLIQPGPFPDDPEKRARYFEIIGHSKNRKDVLGKLAAARELTRARMVELGIPLPSESNARQQEHDDLLAIINDPTIAETIEPI